MSLHQNYKNRVIIGCLPTSLDFYTVVEEFSIHSTMFILAVYEPVCSSSGTGFLVWWEGWELPSHPSDSYQHPRASEFHGPVLGVGRGDCTEVSVICTEVPSLAEWWCQVTVRVMRLIPLSLGPLYYKPSKSCHWFSEPAAHCSHFSLLSEKDSFTHTLLGK